jgi:hypothetical protein
VGLFSFGLLDGLHVRLRRPYLREAPAGFGLERLATASMNNPGELNQPVTRKREGIIGAGGKGSQGRGRAAWMLPLARRVRTIRMCSLDARGEGPIQATLRRGEVNAERDGKRGQPGVLLARRTRTMKQCSFDARRVVKGSLPTPSWDKS